MDNIDGSSCTLRDGIETTLESLYGNICMGSKANHKAYDLFVHVYVSSFIFDPPNLDAFIMCLVVDLFLITAKHEYLSSISLVYP